MAAAKQKKKKKSRKSRDWFSGLLKAVAAAAVLAAGFLLYMKFSIRDLSDLAIDLEQDINRILVENGIDTSQITERYQTEKKLGSTSWLLFVKKIKTSDKLADAVIEKIRDYVSSSRYRIIDISRSSDKILVDTGYGKTVLNSLVLNIYPEKGLIAIIVDDLGYTKNIQPFLELDIPLTYAIIPDLPYSSFLAAELDASGLPYILHMPMEPVGYPAPGKNPGELALFVGMDEQEIKKNIDKALVSVEGARGMNNHMGSRFTSDSRSMKLLMKILKEKNMFFVDSATSKSSIGYRTALEFGVPTVKNNFYLDNQDDFGYISGRVKKLMEQAAGRRKTIAICHMTRKNTARAIKIYLPQFKARGLRFVPVKDILE